ncbi:MAG: hypothetical protein ACYTGZ_12160 [Planctomycetota bacterium]
MTLDPERIQRYQRQLLLAPVGGEGQERLAASTLLLHGHAPLCATYLAAAGLGALLVTGAIPDLSTRDPGFRIEQSEVAAPSDLVLDLADGAAYAAASESARLWGGIASSRLLLGCEPVAGEPAAPEDRAVLEILAAGEALWRLLGREPHAYDYPLRVEAGGQAS